MVEAINCSIGDLSVVLQRLWKNMPECTPFISGPTGIGKSEVVRQAADAAGFSRVIDVRLAGLLPEDIRGIPRPSGEYFTMAVMKNLEPMFSSEKLVMFFDEFNQGSTEVLSAMFQLVYDLELNGKRIGPNVRLVAAGNLGDVYDVTQMSPALERRFIHVNVMADKISWLRYMRARHDVDSGVLAFIEKRSEDALSGVTENAVLSPAQWTRVAEYLHRTKKDGSDEAMKVNQIVVSGIVGKSMAVALMRFLDTFKAAFNPERIILEPSDRLLPDIQDMVEKGHNSQLAELCTGLVAILGSKYELSEIAGERVAAFSKALPPELSTKLLLDLKNNVPGIFTYFPADATAGIIEKNMGMVMPDLPS